MKKCEQCNSNEYLFWLVSMEDIFAKNRNSFSICLSCINFQLRNKLGDDYLEVLSSIQKLDESKFELKQKEVSLHLKIKEAVSKNIGEDSVKKFLNEEGDY